MRVLVVNAGSSSLKLSVLDGDVRAAQASLPMPDGKVDIYALEGFLNGAGSLDATGHRVVHGGTEFVGPTLVDSDVRRRLETFTALAPLHQPTSLAALDVVARLLPEVPAVACFDTAFHATIPQAAATYAIPAEWRERWPLRRFGFHGLSHAYVARRAAAMVDRPVEALRIVSAHLGAGASLAAISSGRSVDTTMGFTPLEGLVMATRSGSVDPGLVLWLLMNGDLSPGELSDGFERRSGLVGLAGSAEMAEILARESRGEADAVLAVGAYLHRLAGGIAAMTAALGGLDVLAFTGGVGENAATLRWRCAEQLGFLGIVVDRESNDRAAPDCGIGPVGATVRTLVIAAGEDLQIAGEVRELLDPPR